MDAGKNYPASSPVFYQLCAILRCVSFLILVIPIALPNKNFMLDAKPVQIIIKKLTVL